MGAHRLDCSFSCHVVFDQWKVESCVKADLRLNQVLFTQIQSNNLPS